MRIATWNVNSLTTRLQRVLMWIEEHQPDVLCMQETKQADDAFPTGAFAEVGYETVHHGDGRWNGVAIASRVGAEAPSRGFESDEDAHGCRIVAATCGGVRVHSVYVPNGRSLDNEQYTFKLAWLARLREYLAQTCEPGSNVAVCGDFNVAPSDADLWDPAQFVGMTHASEPERQALQAILDDGFVDVFGARNPEGGVFSWWDYRAGSFHKGQGMRIDLVLLNSVLAGKVTNTYIDREARKTVADLKPSDHTLVVVDVDLPTG